MIKSNPGSEMDQTEHFGLHIPNMPESLYPQLRIAFSEIDAALQSLKKEGQQENLAKPLAQIHDDLQQLIVVVQDLNQNVKLVAGSISAR